MARHRSPQGRRASLGLLAPQCAVPGAGGVGGFPAGPHVRHARSDDGGSRFSVSTRIAAAVVAVGGLAGAAHTAAGSPELPMTAWLDTAASAATADAALPAPRVSPEDTRAAIADPATIAALATPAAAGGSVAMRTVNTAGSDVAGRAADAAGSASDSVRTVQAAAAERARAAAAAPAATAPAATAPADEAPRATRQAASAGAVSIVSGRVTSGFGSRWGSQHKGLDIAAPIGTPIHVPLGGTVISSGAASGFGMWVRVRHDDGTVTVYGHINRSLVSVGEQVTAGQQIAEVGNRGQSSGPHLHIEVVTPDGTKINPRPWLDERGFSYT